VVAQNKPRTSSPGEAPALRDPNDQAEAREAWHPSPCSLVPPHGHPCLLRPCEGALATLDGFSPMSRIASILGQRIGISTNAFQLGILTALPGGGRDVEDCPAAGIHLLSPSQHPPWISSHPIASAASQLKQKRRRDGIAFPSMMETCTQPITRRPSPPVPSWQVLPGALCLPFWRLDVVCFSQTLNPDSHFTMYLTLLFLFTAGS
jgi:hypothetical protein